MPPNVEDCPLIVIGSRKHLQNEALAKRNYFRYFIFKSNVCSYCFRVNLKNRIYEIHKFKKKYIQLK